MMRIGSIVLLALVPVLAQAQMYKWVDENGRTQYSDRPPPAGVKFDTIETKTAPAPPTQSSGSPKSASALEMEFRKRQLRAAEDQKETEQKEQEAKAKQQQCDAALSQLKVMEIGGRVLKPSPTGEREVMGDDELAAGRVAAQKRVDEVCK